MKFWVLTIAGTSTFNSPSPLNLINFENKTGSKFMTLICSKKVTHTQIHIQFIWWECKQSRWKGCFPHSAGTSSACESFSGSAIIIHPQSNPLTQHIFVVEIYQKPPHATHQISWKIYLNQLLHMIAGARRGHCLFQTEISFTLTFFCQRGSGELSVEKKWCQI